MMMSNWTIGRSTRVFDEMYNSVASGRASYGGEKPTSAAVLKVYLQHEVTLYS